MTKEIIGMFFYILLVLAAVLVTVRIIKSSKEKDIRGKKLSLAAAVSLVLYFVTAIPCAILYRDEPVQEAFFHTIAFMEVPGFSGGFLLMTGLFLGAVFFNGPLEQLMKKSGFLHFSDTEQKRTARSLPVIIKDKRPILTYVGLYTLCFCVLCLGVFSVNFILDRGFVWRVDAMPQYITYLKYMGEYLREFIGNIFHGEFTLKMFDFTIGMGEDVRAVFRTHPTEFLSVLVPGRYVEILYNLLMILRFYLAGLAFSAYCFYRKKPRLNTLLGAMIYVFSGYILFPGTKHPVFSAPMILLPLLFVALDRLIKKKGMLLYSVLVGLTMFTNYYFLYMCTFAMGVYALIRFFQIYRENLLREFACMMGRIVFYYLLGCGLVAVFFIPAVWRTLTSERVGAGKVLTENLWFYSDNRLPTLFLSTISGSLSAGYSTHLSFAALVLPAGAVLFLRKWREHAGIKIALILEAIAMSVPAFGFMMSAFSNINNRWVFIVTFTVAFMVVCVMDDFKSLTRLQILGICAVTAAYGISWRIWRKNSLDIRMSFMVLVGTVLVILLINYIKHITRRQLWALLSLCTAVSVGIHGVYLFGKSNDPFFKDFMKNGEVVSKIEDSTYAKFAEIEEDGFYRSDTHTMNDTYENTGIFTGYRGTSMYNSVINSNVVQYHCDMANIGISAVHRLFSMDGRTAMEALGSVKYYMTEAGMEEYVPYGFRKVEELCDEETWIYENEYPLSVGYTYGSFLLQEDYEKLTPLEKQQVMLEAAVINNEPAGEIEESLNQVSAYSQTIETTIPKIEYMDEGVTYDEEGFHVENPETTASFSFERKEGYETYLYFYGLEKDDRISKIFVSAGDITKTVAVRGEAETYSLGRSDYLVNLGHKGGSGTETITLTFRETGTYALETMELCYVPLEGYEEKIESLGDGALENVTLDTNRISGTVFASKDKIMAFSVPRSSGWKVYVDQEETKSFKVNTAYMGIFLPEGEHDIQLVYTTPGIWIGFWITAGSILIFAILVIYQVKSRKKEQKCLKKNIKE